MPIWYANIPEETSYIIERTMAAPWNKLAWTIFIGCFIAPFLILINRRIKMIPRAMVVICLAVMAGIWLEHYLLLGPAFNHHIHHLRPRIPNYHLQACQDSIPVLQAVPPLTLRRSLRSVFLNLWVSTSAPTRPVS